MKLLAKGAAMVQIYMAQGSLGLTKYTEAHASTVNTEVEILGDWQTVEEKCHI